MHCIALFIHSVAADYNQWIYLTYPPKESNAQRDSESERDRVAQAVGKSNQKENK